MSLQAIVIKIVTNLPINSLTGQGVRELSKRFIITGAIAAFFLVTLLLGVWIYLTFTSWSTVGLEGKWRDPANPRHTHQFRSNGTVDTWFGTLPMEQFATWRRDGQQISVLTTRGWDFVGELDGGAIRGKMIIRDENGTIVNTTDTFWLKE